MLVLGGIAAIYFGYRLFASGAGLAKAIDKLDFKNTSVKVSAAGMSVGAVLMLTSGVWSYFAYSSFPKLQMAGDNIVIGNLSIPNSQGNSEVALSKVVGAPVFASDKQQIGNISQILLNEKAHATGVIVNVAGSSGKKAVLVDPTALNFEKSGSQLNAVFKMNKGEFDKAPVMTYNPPAPQG
jgi:hypothetical protein